MPCLGQSSGLLICSKQRILSEQHHVFQHRRMVTAKGWLEIEDGLVGGLGIDYHPYARVDLRLQDLPRGHTLGWLQLPKNHRPIGGSYHYWRISSVPPSKWVNVYSIFWEYAKKGIVTQGPYHGDRVDSYCLSLLVVDFSVGDLPCAAWNTAELLPACSIQVKVRQVTPGALVNMPFLKVGDIVRAHRMGCLRNAPKFLNLWWRTGFSALCKS
eukprot:Skav233764  [mRNA]  locus=scaffold2701:195569:211290:+ [translate_table: standard]